jgi:hypothetical protein
VPQPASTQTNCRAHWFALPPTTARLPPLSHPAVPLAIGGAGLPADVKLRDDLPEAGLANVAATVFELLGYAVSWRGWVGGRVGDLGAIGGIFRRFWTTIVWAPWEGLDHHRIVDLSALGPFAAQGGTGWVAGWRAL